MAELHHIDELRRAKTAGAVMQVLDAWGVQPEHQMLLLGFPDDTKLRTLNRFRRGMALPKQGETAERVSYLLIIDRAAHSMYPHSAVAANCWVTTANPYFNGRSPLEIMLLSGLAGMRWVVEHLEGSSPWG